MFLTKLRDSCLTYYLTSWFWEKSCLNLFQESLRSGAFSSPFLVASVLEFFWVNRGGSSMATARFYFFFYCNLILFANSVSVIIFWKMCIICRTRCLCLAIFLFECDSSISIVSLFLSFSPSPYTSSDSVCIIIRWISSRTYLRCSLSSLRFFPC
jgi:hypothetical protein